jgi:acetoin utilization deacetylase AcuC-like enzyme
MSIDAMKQALDALEEHGTHYARHEDDYIKAITALRQAIAEAEKQDRWDKWDGWVLREVYFSEGEPIGHREPQWVDLTDDDIWKMFKHLDPMRYIKVSRAIKDKAIAEAEKQEPVSIKKVAKAHGIDMPDHFRDATKKVVPSNYSNSHQPVAWREIMGKWKTHYYDYNEDGRGEPLYAAPPKREWVGLTDHELQVLDFNDPERGKLARAIDAKLKERNT